MTAPSDPARPRLVDQVRGALRVRHMSRRTEVAYVQWIVRYVRHHRLRHPRELGEPEIVAFLTWLADDERVSRSTQMQALSALNFLYRVVLGREISDLRHQLRSVNPQRLPAVLSREEVRRLLDVMDGEMRLVALLLYGSGL